MAKFRFYWKDGKVDDAKKQAKQDMRDARE